jgi:hypothetical protein
MRDVRKANRTKRLIMIHLGQERLFSVGPIQAAIKASSGNSKSTGKLCIVTTATELLLRLHAGKSGPFLPQGSRLGISPRGFKYDFHYPRIDAVAEHARH